MNGELLNVWLLLSLNSSLIFSLEKDELDFLINKYWLIYQDVYTYSRHIEYKKVLLDQGSVTFSILYTFGISNWPGNLPEKTNTDWFNKALFEAARRNDVVFAHWCVLNGADLNYAQTAFDKEGKTPFHEAAAYGCLAMLRYLKHQGAHINPQTTLGWTALNSAHRWNRTEAITFLEENGAVMRPVKTTWKNKKFNSKR